MLGVFLISALVHEYIFCFVLGFFYPVMLTLFLVTGGELGPSPPQGRALRDARLMAEAAHLRLMGLSSGVGWGGLGGGEAACGRRFLAVEERGRAREEAGREVRKMSSSYSELE